MVEEVLQRNRPEDCPWDEETYSKAALNHLELLQCLTRMSMGRRTKFRSTVFLLPHCLRVGRIFDVKNGLSFMSLDSDEKRVVLFVACRHRRHFA